MQREMSAMEGWPSSIGKLDFALYSLSSHPCLPGHGSVQVVSGIALHLTPVEKWDIKTVPYGKMSMLFNLGIYFKYFWRII